MSRWTYHHIPRPPVAAIQWDGTNFREVQEFFEEQGPYRGGEPIELRLGEDFYEIPTTIYFTWNDNDLALDKGCWLVLTREDAFMMMTDKRFREEFKR